MGSNIEKSVLEIKAKILSLIKERKINATQLALDLNINKNYFTDLKKKKTFSITELSILSESFNYNLFDLIEHRLTEKKSNISDKKAKVSIVIEVDNESEERKILEMVLDRPTVKKLLGE
ncbi:MAG: helix-turn-helix domain-containing protein [Sediminibacterium sp.]|nr:helix-turn-helix domain-containing protein [Sediminibacterium sp.]